MDSGTITLIAVGLPASVGVLGVWLGGRIQIKIKEIDTAAKEREIERMAKDKDVAEKTRQEMISTIEEIVIKHIPRCTEVHESLEKKLLVMAEGKIKEAENAHADIINSMSGIVYQMGTLRNEITEMFKEKSAESGIKDKFIRVSNNALKFFGNESVRKFAIYKANAFFDFIMAYRNSIFSDEDSFENAKNVVTTLYETVKNEGYNLAGREFTDLFYDRFHKTSTEAYFSKLDFISKDTVNDKHIRFVDESMSYLQQFLSEMVQAYGVWKEEQLVDLKHTHDEEINKKEKL